MMCKECETVAHCTMHGCIPKQTALDKKAENARELGLDYEPVREDWGPGPHECHSLTAPVQEPVAWRYRGILHDFDPSDWAEGPVTPLYTTPPAQPAPVQEPVTDSYVQQVPSKCDRILWRGSYYHLPPAAPVQEPCSKCHGVGYYDEGHENDDGSMSGGNYVECEKCKPPTAPAQEPVGYFSVNDYGNWEQNESGRGEPFYTAPPASQRTWVGLTDEEILKLAYPIRWQEVDDFEADKAVNFARAIEAKLKEKNT